MLSPVSSEGTISTMLSDLNLGTPNSKTTLGVSKSKIKGRIRGKVLFPPISSPEENQTPLQKWTEQELYALSTFIRNESSGRLRVAHKDMDFWDRAAVYVQKQSKATHRRTGKSCRSKASHTTVKQLASLQYLSSTLPVLSEPCASVPAQSSESTLPSTTVHLPPVNSLPSVQLPPVNSSPSMQLPPVNSLPSMQLPPVNSSPSMQLPPVNSLPLVQLPPVSLSVSSLPSAVHDQLPPMSPQLVELYCGQFLSNLTSDQQLLILSKLFAAVLKKAGLIEIPYDFLKLSADGMKHLQECKRTNVIYRFARVLGTMRYDKSDSLLPAKRMPMGLIEYSVNFFNADHINAVKCPSDYRSWLETMYTLFGTKWCNIFTGPLWSYAPVAQTGELQQSLTKDPKNALVNIPALSERTLRRGIASGDFSTGPDIQIKVLEKLANLNPNVYWWIKGDGTDIVKGLWQSTSGEWAGDIDLNDGKLQQQYNNFKCRMEVVKNLGIGKPFEEIKNDLSQEILTIRTNLTFVSHELQNANKVYEEKLQSGATERNMFSLSWEIEELKSINSEGRRIDEDLIVCTNFCSPGLFQQHNIAGKLTSIRQRLLQFTKRLTYFKRQPATHVFVLMISPEMRDKKPYAVPVQCLPYAGLKEVDIRTLISALCRKMIAYKMKISGFVTDGEFNYLRTKGYTRPLSVLQIRCTVRNKYSKQSCCKLLAMLTPKKLPDNTLIAECHNSAVPMAVLQQINNWRMGGLTMHDIVQRLRVRTVPSGHVFHTWKPGKTESFQEQMKSILAQFEYTNIVKEFDLQGVPFRTYLYVPEKHPETNEVFYEREDDAHLLKRIASHTRNGGPDGLKLERYAEALEDCTSGLTYPALTGARKQSVVDAERLFSPDLETFMANKGYQFEANYIRTIWNWRRASDERGLCERERSKFNYQLLNMMLDELMPWHKQSYDFSLLEVNRCLNNVLGFSKETLVALITNIEGREWHRREVIGSNRKPEHPRASSTDDVECFFSMMRDSIGRNFTTKQAGFNIRKVYGEFIKRLDPDLPFFYHTSAHTRYYEGPLPNFDTPSLKPPKKKKVPRREQPAAFAPRRATMPIRGSLSVRPKFHNLPLELPPPPGGSVHLIDHSYA